MAKLVLRLRRGGRLLGSWTLGDQPLEFSLVDVATGQEIGSFAARGSADQGVDEVPMPGVARLDGDDFTVPLPEPTRSAPGLVESITTEERKAVVPNLAGRGPGDDFTMPVPEHAQGRSAVSRAVTPRMRALPLDRVPVAKAPPTLDPLEEHTADIPEVTLGDALTGEVLSADVARSAEKETEEIESREPERGGFDAQGFDPSYLARALGNQHFDLDPETREIPPPAEDDEPPVRPAEVWVRKRSEWRSAGRLVSGQRVRMLGGWMRLRADGRLVVYPGSRMAGSGTMVDGRHVEITPGQDAISLPAGASVLLCYKEHGLYVRSEPLAESTDAIAYDSETTAQPPQG